MGVLGGEAVSYASNALRSASGVVPTNSTLLSGFGSRNRCRYASTNACPYAVAVYKFVTAYGNPFPVTTQGPSWRYLKVYCSETLSIFGDKFPHNGSKNDTMALITTL